MKKIINPWRNHEGYLVMGTSGVRSGLIDLFPKDKNRETEVSRGFRFFVSGWGEMKKIK